jgi:Tfp pilus assembly protein PilV
MRAIANRLKAGLRGTSLLEVLIAMAIMSLMIVGTLQMFFVALASSQNASTRTQLTFKAQQVAENIRFLQYQAQQYAQTSTQFASGLTIPITAATQGSLPYTQSDPYYAYWGPAGTNIIEGEKMPYKINYSIADNTSAQTWIVTITAVPVQASSSAGSAGSDLYRGPNLMQQKVQYVFSMHK